MNGTLGRALHTALLHSDLIYFISFAFTQQLYQLRRIQRRLSLFTSIRSEFRRKLVFGHEEHVSVAQSVYTMYIT